MRNEAEEEEHVDAEELTTVPRQNALKGEAQSAASIAVALSSCRVVKPLAGAAACVNRPADRVSPQRTSRERPIQNLGSTPRSERDAPTTDARDTPKKATREGPSPSQQAGEGGGPTQTVPRPHAEAR